tara:strand:+ start:722 stop:913 length:192 start_codon:yes stop_codon:yes gene_type:complete
LTNDDTTNVHCADVHRSDEKVPLPPSKVCGLEGVCFGFCVLRFLFLKFENVFENLTTFGATFD